MLNIFKIVFIINTLILFQTQAQSQESSSSRNINFNFNTSKTLNHNGLIKQLNKKRIGADLTFNNKRFKTNLSFNIHNQNKIYFHKTSVEYHNNNHTFGLGSINRNWSFSPNNSLILSSNSSPFKSVYYKVANNNIEIKRFPPIESYSFEIFNGLTKGAPNPKNSMLFGMRLTLATTKRFEMEAIRTVQWGGNGYNNSISSIPKFLFSDTNSGNYSHINQMAGFGFQYSFPEKTFPLRIYGQVIGEDEAGNLPSCLSYLSGAELNKKIFKKDINFGIEIITTEVDYTEHKYCGPTTAYNNDNYKYTNKGTVMGVPIDGDSKSIEIYGIFKITEELNTNFMIKKVSINSANNSNHRLTSKNKRGWMLSTGVTRTIKNGSINGKINYQTFPLENINSPKGIGFSFFSNIYF